MKQSFNPGAMLCPVPAVMVTCGEGEEKNIITIAWTGIINSNPPMTYVSVRPSRHSHALIEKTGEFVINLTTEELAFATDYCGVKSGKDVDKFKEMKLTPVRGTVVKCPLIDESPVNLECKVTEVKRFGTHDMFIAEIVAMHANDEIIDDKGKIDLAKAGLVSYIHGEYFAVKKAPLGKFGYSIMKPKTKKRINKEKHEERVEKNRTKRADSKKAEKPEKTEKAERKPERKTEKKAYAKKADGKKTDFRKSDYKKPAYSKKTDNNKKGR